ncbi:MAG: hypothetical protein KF796_14140 [Ramlibacter sp.]|nr:hypothetical protein [Ramlibacter sp.]
MAIETADPSLTQAAIKWISSRGGLSEATVNAYLGEINRFAEHLASKGVLRVRSVGHAAWENYLQLLMEKRSTVPSRRTDALKSTSALQAARITRSFLRFCWASGWLGWVPDLGSRRCGAAVARLPVSVPKELAHILLADGRPDGEAEARQVCAAALAFWVGMKPRELSTATVSNLRTLPAGVCSIAIAGREHEAHLPDQLVAQMRHYHALRAERVGPMPDGAPLISRLGTYMPLGASAVWQLLRTLPSLGGPTPISIGAKRIRECFVVLGGDDAAASVAAIRRQAGSRRIILHPGNENPIRPQAIAEKVSQLLEAELLEAEFSGGSSQHPVSSAMNASPEDEINP